RVRTVRTSVLPGRLRCCITAMAHAASNPTAGNRCVGAAGGSSDGRGPEANGRVCGWPAHDAGVWDRYRPGARHPALPGGRLGRAHLAMSRYAIDALLRPPV